MVKNSETVPVAEDEVGPGLGCHVAVAGAVDDHLRTDGCPARFVFHHDGFHRSVFRGYVDAHGVQQKFHTGFFEHIEQHHLRALRVERGHRGVVEGQVGHVAAGIAFFHHLRDKLPSDAFHHLPALDVVKGEHRVDLRGGEVASDKPVLFDEHGLCSHPCGGNGSPDARGSGTDDENVGSSDDRNLFGGLPIDLSVFGSFLTSLQKHCQE